MKKAIKHLTNKKMSLLSQMLLMLDKMRSKADYEKMVMQEKLRTDCITVLMTTQPTNYN